MSSAQAQFIIPENEEMAELMSIDQLVFTEKCFNIVSPGDDYIPNWHVDCIIEYLQAVERGEIKRLIINIPPRTMKSICVSIAWPAWLLGQNPMRRIICACYGDRLSKRLSVDTRLTMNADIYKLAFPNTRIAYDQNEKTLFKTTKQGFRMSTSVGGSVTGDGGDFLIIDDPLKPDESLSEVSRETANHWITNTFLQRQNKPGESAIVMIMQRLHEEDPSGLLMDSGGWESLVLPAEFHKKTIISINDLTWEVEEGELLHEERLSKVTLDEKLKDLGQYGYAGQYLQRPAPIGGGEFKQHWMKYYNNLSKNFSAKGMNVIICVDPASGKKIKTSGKNSLNATKEIAQCYTSMIVVGLHSDKNYYILDIIRDRFNPTQRIDTLIKLHMKWNKLSGKPPKVAYEDYGMQSDCFYIEKAMNDLNYRFSFIPVGGKMEKTDRIRRWIPDFENNRVFLPRRINYTDINGDVVELSEVFANDLLVFPVCKYFDMLDAFARLLDKEVYATFPSTNLKIHRVGETYRDELLDGFVEENFATW